MKSSILFNLKKGYLFLLVMLFPVLGKAQESDFQIWGDVKAKYEFNKKWKIDGEIGLRTRENSQLLKQYYLELGGSYKINKRFDLSTKYRFTNYFELGKTSIHRWSMDLSYDNKWNRYSWELRGRYQQEWFVSNYSNEFEEQSWRTKFELSYDIRKNKLEPYFSFEHFMGLNGENAWLTTDLRWTLGAEFPINKWSDLDLSYKIETELNEANPLTGYILSVTYKIDLN